MEYFPGVRPIGDPLADTDKPTGPTRLEVHIHLINGSIEKFNQLNEDTLKEHFATLQPNKLFSQRHLAIDTPDGVFAYPAEALCRVDYLMDWTPGWAVTKGREVYIISPEEFRENRKQCRQTREDIRELKPGDSFTGHTVIELANAEKVYLRVEAVVPSKLDQRMTISQLLQGGTIMGKLKDGGVGFLNSNKIVRVGFYPGVPDISPDAWKMNCL